MKCDQCERQMNYAFHVDDVYWLHATSGVKEGHLCPSCVCDAIGGVRWLLVWDDKSIWPDPNVAPFEGVPEFLVADSVLINPSRSEDK